MRTFEVTLMDNWRIVSNYFETANSHSEVKKNLELKCHRIKNDRFREIETTGKYYMIEDVQKFGKTFVYEVLKQQP